MGDRLITGPDSNAVLTFFEGSTFTLTPNTDIVVERLQGDAESRDFSLRLNVGTIWARVASLVSPAARFEVKASNAVAVVRGSQIGARVLADGSFQCWTREGAMSIETSAGQHASLVAGETVVVQPDGQLSANRPFEPAASLVRITTSGPVWAVLVHPDGGANGVVEPGVTVSQTFGALVSPFQRGGEGLAFEVPASQSGTYTLVLEGRAEAADGADFGLVAAALLAPIYAGTPDATARLLAREELAGRVAAGERVAFDLHVDVVFASDPGTLLTSMTASAPYAVGEALGPAKVYVSPLEAARLA
ncbi:MAG TPA: FecR family protein [Chloroflexota bacterium]|nr:FecR family protein [Chloroflexota bacterium]